VAKRLNGKMANLPSHLLTVFPSCPFAIHVINKVVDGKHHFLLYSLVFLLIKLFFLKEKFGYVLRITHYVPNQR